MSNSKTWALPDKAYRILKPVATTILPGIATFYFALANIWGIPEAEKVVATITALNTLLGIVVNLSSVAYRNDESRFDGAIEVMKEDASLVHQLDIAIPPEQLKDKDQVTFKVRKIPGKITKQQDTE